MERLVEVGELAAPGNTLIVVADLSEGKMTLPLTKNVDTEGRYWNDKYQGRLPVQGE